MAVVIILAESVYASDAGIRIIEQAGSNGTLLIFNPNKHSIKPAALHKKYQDYD